MRKEEDVVIVGAGPVGLTLANILGLQAVRTLVVDERPTLIDYPRGVGLDDEAIRTFQSIGLVDRILPHTVPNQILRFFDAKRRLLAEMAPPDARFGWPKRNGFVQPMVDAELLVGLDRFDHVEVAWNRRMEGCTETDDGVTEEARVLMKPTLALCCMSHSPLLNLPGPSQDLLDDIESALRQARDFVAVYDPDLVVIFSPDHYNGFFYRTMPPFCIGTAAQGVGDYGTHAGPLNVPEDIATECARAVLESGIDVAISASMDVDHGTVQPLQKLFGDAGSRPVIPIFINSVATPLGPLRRVRALGAAVGMYLATFGKRVLVVGSGGLSHDPPVPTLATAPPAALDRIVHGNPMTPEQGQARQVAVMEAAREFADGEGPLQPLNPDWDHAFLELLDSNRLPEVDAWSNSWIEQEAGHSAHEIRTWVAAFAAMAAHGRYETQQRFYRAAPELIAGFAIRRAVLNV